MPETSVPKSAKGIPIWVWAAAGATALIVGYFFLRTNNNPTTQTQGAAGDQNASQTPDAAALLNQYSWMNSYLAMISQQIAGIGSTQGATATPPPPPPPPPQQCCPPHMGILCRIGIPLCPVPKPHHSHDGSGVTSPGTQVNAPLQLAA